MTHPSNYPSIERTAKLLPAHEQIALLRAVAGELTWSDGGIAVLDGCDQIEADLRSETLRNDEPGVRQEAA